MTFFPPAVVGTAVPSPAAVLAALNARRLHAWWERDRVPGVRHPYVVAVRNLTGLEEERQWLEARGVQMIRVDALVPARYAAGVDDAVREHGRPVGPYAWDADRVQVLEMERYERVVLLDYRVEIVSPDIAELFGVRELMGTRTTRLPPAQVVTSRRTASIPMGNRPDVILVVTPARGALRLEYNLSLELLQYRTLADIMRHGMFYAWAIMPTNWVVAPPSLAHTRKHEARALYHDELGPELVAQWTSEEAAMQPSGFRSRCSSPVDECVRAANQSYVAYLSSDQDHWYVEATRMMFHRVRAACHAAGRPARQFTVTVLRGNVSTATHDLLRRDGFNVIEVAPLRSPGSIGWGHARYRHVWPKMRMFEVPFDRVVYLEPDQLSLDSCPDSTFDYPRVGPTLYAAYLPMCSVGFMAVDPSLRVMEELEREVENSTVAWDQDFLCRQFGLESFYVPWWYDGYCRILMHPDRYAHGRKRTVVLDYFWRHAHFVHYSGPKPWQEQARGGIDAVNLFFERWMEWKLAVNESIGDDRLRVPRRVRRFVCARAHLREACNEVTWQ